MHMVQLMCFYGTFSTRYMDRKGKPRLELPQVARVISDNKMADLNDFVLHLEKELTCSICQELFHEPKTLQPCLHSFCQKCLQNWHKTCRKRKKQLTCPTCKTPVRVKEGDVSKLKSSFYLESLKDLLLAMRAKAGEQDQHNFPNCVQCQKHITLIAFCPQCEGMVCADCKNAHNTMKLLREEHQVKLFAELKQEHVNTYISNQQRCSEKFHEKFKLEYYCKECEKTICQSCSITDHSNHKNILVEVKAEEIKGSIHQDLDRVNQQKQRLLKELQLSKKNLTRIENELSTAKQEVHDQVRAQIKILQDHQNIMNVALDKMFIKQKRESEEEQREIFAGIQQLDALNKQGKELQQQNVPHFVLESQFGERCQQLLQNRSILKTKPILRNKTLRYLPAVTQLDLGRIVESVTDPSRCSVMQSLYSESVIKCEIVTKNSEDKVCYTNQGSIDVNIQDANGGEIENELNESETGKFLVTFKAKKPSPCQIRVSIGGQEIKDSPKTLYGNIDFKPVKIFGDNGKGKLNGPFSLTLGVHGEVVIADCSNHRIVVFDADGEYVRHFGTFGTTDGKLRSPFGVVMRDNTIYVSDNPPDTGRIQEFDANRAYLRTIYNAQQQVLLRGMCAADRHIAVCFKHLNDKTQSGIKLLSTQSGKVVQEISTPGKAARYIAYDNNKYFISYDCQNHVDVYDENLALLYTFGSKGKESGQFENMRGLAVHSGQLFVCDGDNHRVQVFTQDGLFIKSFGSHGSGTGQMNFPNDVVVTSDRKVLVLECKGNRVQLWQ